jgi:Trm5-related predicted tRNA methylase
MFVAVINSMKKREDKIIEQIPQTVSEMRVYCFDHMTQMTVLSASWSDVRSYLKGQINGDQFGYRVRRNP